MKKTRPAKKQAKTTSVRAITGRARDVNMVVVGSIGLDNIATPYEKRERLLGGSVSYACAAASFFTRPGMVGIVGRDFPESYLQLYQDMGIDLAGLQQVDGKTFHWSGQYDADMINRRTLITDLNVFETFMPELPANYRKVPYLMLGNIAPDLQMHVLTQCRRPKFVVADTMDLWIKIARESLMKVIGRVDMLALNDSEARLLTGIFSVRKAAQRILEWGPRYVVIKKGEHGAVLVAPDGIFIVPAYPLEDVRDPTGAGDTFAGAFLGALARSGRTDARAVRAALVLGSVVASFGVEAFSLNRLARLTKPEIRARLTEIKRMMRVVG